jgi:hypothetical protein
MAIVIPDVYTLKARFNGSGREWFNSIDIRSPVVGGPFPDDTADAVVSFINWLPPNTANATTIVDVSCYKKREGKGALPIVDTLPLFVHPLNEPGTREDSYGDASASQQLDMQVVAYVKKITSGRSGRMFIRNLLKEGDVQSAVGSFWVFSGGTGTVNPTTFHAQVSAHLNAHFAGGSGVWKYCVVHARLDTAGVVLEHTVTDINDMILDYAGLFRRKR